MDPDANLAEQLKLARELLDACDSEFDGSLKGLAARDAQLEEIAAKAARLADLVDGLDAWLKMGGFLPKRWERK